MQQLLNAWHAIFGMQFAYNPNEVFYLSTNGNYFVDVGTHYRINSKWSPVRAGINRHFLKAGINKSEARDLISDAKEDIEVDRSVDWAGSIAGMKKGKHDLSDKSLLIVDEPRLFDSIEGKFPLLNSIVNQGFTHAVRL